MSYEEIFIFALGTTPQIITETLYAFQLKNPPIHPNEILVITTVGGKKVLEKELLECGRLKAFYNEFGIKPVIPVVHLISGKDGYLEDIRTEEDNDAVGNFIAEIIRNKTEEGGTRLHCSIAGGRKTMSYYLGSALSLFGRQSDKLYHVLVSQKFESNPEFYWKPKVDKLIKVKAAGKDIQNAYTSDAVISLTELPFIRLQGKISLSEKRFKELVREGQKEIDTASVQSLLKINFSERTMLIGTTVIEVLPMQLAIYSAFVREKIERCHYPKRPYCQDCIDCFPSLIDMSTRRYLEQMADDYKQIYGRNISRVEELLKQWGEGIDIPTLRQNISKLNRTIREHLRDETIASFYTINSVGKHGSKRHGIRLEKMKMEII